MTLVRSDFAWAAGFLEGEGSFTYQASLAVSASQVQRWPLERMASLFGGRISTNGRVTQPQRQLCFVWYLHGHRAAGLMMTLFLLLSPRRRDQIRRALTIWRSKAVAPSQRLFCPFGHPYTQQKHRRRCPTCSNASHARWLRRKQVDRVAS